MMEFFMSFELQTVRTGLKDEIWLSAGSEVIDWT